MGGMLHPICEGELMGQIAGVKNPDNIVPYIIRVGADKIPISDYYKLSPEYYMGFGVGYQQGQQWRELLQADAGSPMSADEKIQCFATLLEEQKKYRHCYTQEFLNNIQFWHQLSVPKVVIQEITELLQNKKVQRAADRLFHYYKNHFQLKGLVEYYKIYKQLRIQRMSFKKQKGQDVLSFLSGFSEELLLWLKNIPTTDT